MGAREQIRVTSKSRFPNPKFAEAFRINFAHWGDISFENSTAVIDNVDVMASAGEDWVDSFVSFSDLIGDKLTVEWIPAENAFSDFIEWTLAAEGVLDSRKGL